MIGQDEAVGAIVDRIAMLKAGLTDAGRPIGVFLFAGPTGTGKTELAKTTARYLFGSAEWLVRLDMSEVQTVESTAKILGSADGGAESLIDRVRRQPFSVVLLDEFEKAHPRVWNLFLQVFDDGRLTDAAGETADFRNSIIILTSNLGATLASGERLGFAEGGDGFSATAVRAFGDARVRSRAAQPPRSRRRVPAVHARRHAPHPAQGDRRRVRAPGLAPPRLGGGDRGGRRSTSSSTTASPPTWARGP